MDPELAALQMTSNVTKEIEKLKRGIITEYISSSDIVEDGKVIFLNLPVIKQDKRFLLRIDYDEKFPQEPADYKFVNPNTKADDDKQYWPDDNQQAFKAGENPRWICLAGTKEYKNKHEGKYNPNTNSLSQTVFHIFRQMNGWVKVG
jgi:hypothetical protein